MTSSTEIARLLGLLLLLSAAGCAKTTDTACVAFQPIRYSPSRDTVETVTQVRQHNAAWKELCR